MVRLLHDDWSIGLGENRPDQISQTVGGYAHITRRDLSPCVLKV